jgi:GTP-binding protein
MNPIVAIVGRPNVGKSTLFNWLAGKRRALTDEVAGVTRDRNYAEVTRGEKTFTLIDTGGFDYEVRQEISSLVRQQAQLAIEEADIIIFMADGKEGLNPTDEDIVRMLEIFEKPVFFVINKVEAKKDHDNVIDFYRLGIGKLYPLSAKHNLGMSEFVEELLAELATGALPVAESGELTKVAVLGRPNVGKSSLVNRMLGWNRVIVSEEPGTTRDAIDTALTWRGRRYLLVDTAGIRRKSRVSMRLEKYSIVEALKALDRSDVGVLLVDGLDGVTEQDAKIGNLIYEKGKGVILAVNKWDLVDKEGGHQRHYENEVRRGLTFLDFAPILFISAVTGRQTQRILPLARQITSRHRARVPTPEVNRILREAVRRHSPPRYRGRSVRLSYGTQVESSPPTFLIFTNFPHAIDTTYQRYLAHQLRAAFDFSGTPLRFLFRKKTAGRSQARLGRGGV